MEESIFDVVARAIYPEDYDLMDTCPGGMDCHICARIKQSHRPTVNRVVFAMLNHYGMTANVSVRMVNAGDQERGTEAIIAAAMTVEAERLKENE